METQKVPAGKFGINYGLILGGLMILIAIFMYMTDMAFKGQQWPVYVYYIAFPVIIIMAIVNYKKYSAGYLNLGDALKLGMAIAAISALTYIVYGLIFNYVIDPEYNAKVIEFGTEQIANSDLPVETKEMQVKVMNFFSDPIKGSAFWLGMSLFFGLIYSLVGGLVMKKTDDH